MGLTSCRSMYSLYDPTNLALRPREEVHILGRKRSATLVWSS